MFNLINFIIIFTTASFDMSLVSGGGGKSTAAVPSAVAKCEQTLTLLKMGILTLAAIVSFSIRLFAVIRFESVIHEFDPYFNYRTTKYLSEQGYYKFHNW